MGHTVPPAPASLLPRDPQACAPLPVWDRSLSQWWVGHFVLGSLKQRKGCELFYGHHGDSSGQVLSSIPVSPQRHVSQSCHEPHFR